MFLNKKLKTQNSKLKTKNKNLKLLDNLKKEFNQIKNKYFKMMEGYKFAKALGLIYEFLWHRLADFYIEQLKDEVINGNIKTLKVLEEVYLEVLKLLHPFAPFVTEVIWKKFCGEEKSILITNF